MAEKNKSAPTLLWTEQLLFWKLKENIRQLKDDVKGHGGIKNL